MPRHLLLPAATLAADALERHGIQHAREPSAGPIARFRVGGSEENLTRAEAALGVLFETLHGEWQTKRCAGVELIRDDTMPAPPPRVLFFRVDRIKGLSDAARTRFGTCPAWFERKEAKERSKLFDRVPEPPVEGPEVDEVLALLGESLKSDGAALLTVIGRTRTMSYGFHTAATHEQALASFREDGFEILSRRADCTWPGVRWPAIVVDPK